MKEKSKDENLPAVEESEVEDEEIYEVESILRHKATKTVGFSFSAFVTFRASSTISNGRIMAMRPTNG
jgi:hypothetical protein